MKAINTSKRSIRKSDGDVEHQCASSSRENVREELMYDEVK